MFRISLHIRLCDTENTTNLVTDEYRKWDSQVMYSCQQTISGSFKTRITHFDTHKTSRNVENTIGQLLKRTRTNEKVRITNYIENRKHTRKTIQNIDSRQ